MSTEESQGEKRARLRRMKILADSERRMNRIIGGVNPSSSATSSNCDSQLPISSVFSSDPLDNVPNQGETHFYENAQSSRMEAKPPTLVAPTALPPRDNEPFPRKVSLISSPIHYKTLQHSQKYNSMLNHPNIINNLRCNSSAKFMFLLVFLSFIGSFFNANILLIFIPYQSFKQAYNGLYRNIWLDFNFGILKELLTSIFSYVIVQVLLKVISN